MSNGSPWSQFVEEAEIEAFRMAAEDLRSPKSPSASRERRAHGGGTAPVRKPTMQVVEDFLGALERKRRNDHVAVPGRGLADGLVQLLDRIGHRAVRAIAIGAFHDHIVGRRRRHRIAHDRSARDCRDRRRTACAAARCRRRLRAAPSAEPRMWPASRNRALMPSAIAHACRRRRRRRRRNPARAAHRRSCTAAARRSSPWRRLIRGPARILFLQARLHRAGRRGPARGWPRWHEDASAKAALTSSGRRPQ